MVITIWCGFQIIIKTMSVDIIEQQLSSLTFLLVGYGSDWVRQEVNQSDDNQKLGRLQKQINLYYR